MTWKSYIFCSKLVFEMKTADFLEFPFSKERLICNKTIALYTQVWRIKLLYQNSQAFESLQSWNQVGVFLLLWEHEVNCDINQHLFFFIVLNNQLLRLKLLISFPGTPKVPNQMDSVPVPVFKFEKGLSKVKWTSMDSFNQWASILTT
jgi:hypothetical protein